MNRARINYIQKVANVINKFNEMKFPVNVEALVNKIGGKILYDTDELNGKDAMIKLLSKDSFEIHLSSFQSPRRKRFSIAHELGHLFVHLGYLSNETDRYEFPKAVYYREETYTDAELEANEFAGCLLMPLDEFKRIAYENFVDGKFNLKPIADAFEVSLEAANVRGKNLGLFSRGA